MSEPTTTAVPKSEDKPTEVTPAVEPSPEPKVETSAPVPDAPKEDVKAGEPTNTETPPVTEDTVQPTTTPATDLNEAKGDDKPTEAPKEERPKSPSIFSRLRSLTNKGGERRAKRKEKMGKKKDENAVPVIEEPVDAVVEPSPAVVKPEENPAVQLNEVAIVEPVKEIEVEPEAPVPQTTSEEVKPKDEGEDAKPAKESPVRLARRFSRQLTGGLTHLFAGPKRKTDVPEKVDEAPPKIEEPAPVAPLENPAADSTPLDTDKPKREETEANEPPKIIDATPAPVVATA